MLEALAELTDDQSSKGGVLQGVIRVHIDHVHSLTGLLLSGAQIFQNSVEDALLTGGIDIKGILAVLNLLNGA